jgi:hypothetical protein
MSPELAPLNLADEIAAHRAAVDAFADLLDDPAAAERKPEVSGWSIAEHADHVAKSTASIARLSRGLVVGKIGDAALEPDDERLTRFLSGRGMPRGGRAPENITAEEGVSAEAAGEALAEAHAALERLGLQAEAVTVAERRFQHPFFGPLKAAEWVRFCGVHAEHHLQIAREVAAG